MANQALATVKEFQALVNSEAVKKRFAEVLGKGAPAFVSTLLTLQERQSATAEM